MFEWVFANMKKKSADVLSEKNTTIYYLKSCPSFLDLKIQTICIGQKCTSIGQTFQFHRTTDFSLPLLPSSDINNGKYLWLFFVKDLHCGVRDGFHFSSLH